MSDELLPPHGGQLRQLAAKFGISPDSLLDFSASISPIAPSDAMIDALCLSLRERAILTHYPDSRLTSLKEAIAAYADTDSACVCIGNGVMPLLGAAVRALDLRRCLMLVPAFGEYQRVLAASAVECHPLKLAEGSNFSLNADEILRRVASTEADALLLANPHSPSGHLEPPGGLTDLVKELSRNGVHVLLDEAFIDYAPQASLCSLAAATAGLVVFRSLTKFFAMPGLRVGYAVVAQDVRAKIEAALPLWPVDAIAARAAEHALRDTALAQRTREFNQTERQWLTEQLQTLGLKVFASAANYLLVKLCDCADGADIWRRLIVEHRIVVRNCGTFDGLSTNFFRIAVSTRTKNEALVSALQSVLALP